MDEEMQAFMDKDAEPDDMGEGGESGGGGLKDLLEANASDIEGLCDDLDQDALMDPEMEMSMEDTAILMQGLTELDEELVSAMKSKGPIDATEAKDLSMQLMQEGAIEDGLRFAGFLQRASQVLGGTGGGDEGVEEDDPDFEGMSDDDLDAYIEG